jgi:hypothetical protein
MNSSSRGDAQVLSIGPETTMALVSCPSCDTAGHRAVILPKPAEKAPAPAYFPFCGAERVRTTSALAR